VRKIKKILKEGYWPDWSPNVKSRCKFYFLLRDHGVSCKAPNGCDRCYKRWSNCPYYDEEIIKKYYPSENKNEPI